MSVGEWFTITDFFVKHTKSKNKIIMNTYTMITKIIARAASLVAVFALVGATALPVLAQWDYDYDYGGDYGYYDDYSYDWDYDYDYGGDYGYYDDYSYDWDYDYDYGGDYAYDWDYNSNYEPYQPYEPYYPSYDYPSYDYDWDYDYPSYDYDWDYDWDYPSYDSEDPGLPCDDCDDVRRPTCTLDASPTRIDNGDDFLLEWTTNGATQVSISTLGRVDLDGSVELSPRETMTYTLFATGPGGVISCTERVVVDEEVPDPENVSCDAFTASDSRVERGDDVTLTWRTTDADSVRIDNGVGTVKDDGTTRVRIDRDTTFTLTARNGSDEDTCRVTVRVEDEEEDDENVSCDAFTASDSRVERGDDVTLTWRTTDADSVRIDNGVGSVADDGSERVRIDRDTTFTLTARNGSDEDTCRVTVRVEDEEEDDEAPRCRMTISDTEITSGQAVTVSWDNLRTDRAILRDNHGNTISDSRDSNGINEDRDSRIFRPTRSTDYTLTVYNGNETRTCTVGTRVGGGVTLTGTRGQDGILLSTVPYTGFEAGPVLTFIFYGAIGLWGVAIAYALVMKKAAIAAVAATAAQAQTFAPIAAMATAGAVEVTPSTESTVSVESASDMLHDLESRAHEQQTLISSEALTHLVTTYGDEAGTMLDRVIEAAKAQFPSEGGWVVLNKDRVLAILG